MNILTKVFLASLSAFLLVEAFPEGHCFIFAWFALVPLLYVLKQCSRLESFLLSLLTGFVYLSVIHMWANIFGIHVWLVLSFYLGLGFALWGLITSETIKHPKLQKFHLFLPALSWVIYEYIRGSVTLSVNWGSIAYSQYTFLPIIQIASITGFYGISFLLLLCNTLLAQMAEQLVKEKSWKIQGHFKYASLTFVCLLTVSMLYGAWCIHKSNAPFPEIKVALLQSASDVFTKWNPKKAWDNANNAVHLTDPVKKEKPHIIFWPETTITIPIPNNGAMTQYISQTAQNLGANLVVGSTSLKNTGTDFKKQNRAFYFDASGNLITSYGKRHLVPFGEYIPLPKQFHKFSVFDRVQDFIQGEDDVIFVTDKVKFGVIICFESDFPQYARNMVKKGAQFIAVITNDGWFEGFPAAEHHISWDVMRAVENQCPIVQSANHGISAVIDSSGKITKRTPATGSGVLLGKIKVTDRGTFYTFFGNIFVYVCIFVFLFIWVKCIIIAPRKKKTAKAGKAKRKNKRK